MVEEIRVCWKTGFPDKEGRYVVLYRYGRQETERLFVADIYSPCTEWSIGLKDVEVTAWLDGLTYSLLSSKT